MIVGCPFKVLELANKFRLEPATDINKTFTRLTAKVKIENVRFHDRHTFASHLVMNGVDLVTIQQLLGHGSINMTMRYSHLAPEHRAKAVKILDSAFKSSTSTKTRTVKNRQRQTSANC
jgi:integrase